MKDIHKFLTTPTDKNIFTLRRRPLFAEFCPQLPLKKKRFVIKVWIKDKGAVIGTKI